jgi:hypothetical protein
MIRPLTEAQAKELAYMWARSVRWPYHPRMNPTRDALVRKELVCEGPDGEWGISETGMESLTAYLTYHARLDDAAMVA